MSVENAKVGDKVTIFLKSESGGGVKLSKGLAGVVTTVGAESGPRVRCEDGKARNIMPINMNSRTTSHAVDQEPVKAKKIAAPAP